MPGPGIALVPFVWNTLQFTTLMGLLYDLDGKVTMDVKQEDLENLDPNLFNSTKEAVREAAIKQHAFDMAGNVEFDENYIQTFTKIEAYVGIDYAHIGWESDTEYCIINF